MTIAGIKRQADVHEAAALPFSYEDAKHDDLVETAALGNEQINAAASEISRQITEHAVLRTRHSKYCVKR